MLITDETGKQTEETSFDGGAPIHARFESHVENAGTRTPLYEWRFIREGSATPFLTRYDADTEYDFTESGSYTVQLLVSFVQGTDTLSYKQDTPFRVVIAESRLEFPNAFTPNGDGINDVFKAKEGYKSIVSFKARIFSRGGKQLYSWNDPGGGWDGRFSGREAPDGAYYLMVSARGADGRNYNIKKTINLLRKFEENGGNGQR